MLFNDKAIKILENWFVNTKKKINPKTMGISQ